MRTFDAELLRRALEARREVHRVADDRVLHALLAADVARDDLAGVDADAGPERLQSALDELHVELRERLAHPDRGAHRVERVVVLRHGRAEDRHDRVADVLVDDAVLFASRCRPSR